MTQEQVLVLEEIGFVGRSETSVATGSRERVIPSRVWLCHRCRKEMFQTFDEACQHAAICDTSGDMVGNYWYQMGRWCCDICHKAVFNSYNKVVAHELICDGVYSGG